MFFIKKFLMIIGLFVSVAHCLGSTLDSITGNLFGTWQYVDFDTSMKLQDFPNAIKNTKSYTGIEGDVLYSFFKELYVRNNITQVPSSEELRIPKVIHIIWLGSPLPDILRVYVNTWIEKHPDWDVYLWDDDAVEEIELYNHDLYYKSLNPGMRSDILRYELIYRYGGLYVDTDFECLQPFDVFHYLYDFYSGLQPLDSGTVQLGCGLFGARPGHPIMKHCVEHLRESYESSNDITIQTGPIHFTKSVYALAGKGEDIDCIFPASYFYPFGCQEKTVCPDLWAAWGSFGIHWWAKTWAGYKYRSEKFKQIRNIAPCKRKYMSKK